MTMQEAVEFVKAQVARLPHSVPWSVECQIASFVPVPECTVYIAEGYGHPEFMKARTWKAVCLQVQAQIDIRLETKAVADPLPTLPEMEKEECAASTAVNPSTVSE